LTPAGTQGFAPHYDEVDIFVVQTQGAKRWRLYPSRNPREVLDEVSSRNFKQNELEAPILDVVLKQGDFLYAPRGTIHQCVASDKDDSMHITISTCLKNSWGELLRRLAPRMIQRAMDSSLELRKSLPRDVYDFMGVMHAGHDKDRREKVVQELKILSHAFCLHAFISMFGLTPVFKENGWFLGAAV
jgi:lysine-specific demethylase/histidyl-hydroxylase NO66